MTNNNIDRVFYKTKHQKAALKERSKVKKS